MRGDKRTRKKTEMKEKKRCKQKKCDNISGQTRVKTGIKIGEKEIRKEKRKIRQWDTKKEKSKGNKIRKKTEK